MKLTVSAVLDRFLPSYLEGDPVLHSAQHRVIWAVTRCRTPAMGGHLYTCEDCARWKVAYHSCNNRSCPRCGKRDNARWVERQLERRVGAPYFMVTFTLPAELRQLFFGPRAREAFDLFFSASSRALAEKLASQKGLRAEQSGFTGVLQTWDQRLRFHPHIHYIVPGAGLDRNGEVVRVKNRNFLLYLPLLKKCFRYHFLKGIAKKGWRVDPAVWRKDWGVHIDPVGDGAAALKYLGAYVCRRTLGDSRLVSIDQRKVSFRYKDRSDHGRNKVESIAGTEFVARFLRHVLPRGFHAIRHYGFCHPAARAKRERIAFHTGRALHVSAPPVAAQRYDGIPKCPCCEQAMKRVTRLPALSCQTPRGPPLSLSKQT